MLRFQVDTAAKDALALLFDAPPYQWQQRLLDDWLLHGRTPETIDIPTGLGKTKVIALWLAALAAGSLLPRRLVYVVDRRAVVDQATTEADVVAHRMRELLANDIIPLEVRTRIRRRLALPEGADATIPVSTLRGQHLDNKRWFERPHAAAIVVGTVDMIGSRVLFSGYGVSPRMRPVHAGLLGCDTLFAVDEAHLVPPFEAMLRGVAAFRASHAAVDAAPPCYVMALSATSGPTKEGTTFRLDAEDRAYPPVAARLTAIKRLVMHETVDTKNLGEGLAAQAWSLGGEGNRVIVFCNSRRDAQKVAENLEDRAKSDPKKPSVQLLVGERRGRERTLLYNPYDPSKPGALDRFSPGATGTTAAYLVATSAGEVGVDLDADHLVCDLVPWERMVQRFGRVNRRSEPGEARIEIIPAQSESDAEDVIAAERLEQLRAPFLSERWPVAADGTRDASPHGIIEAKAALPDVTEAAQTPRPLHPTIGPEIVDAWSLTNLREHPGRPIVAPWLRGWVEDRPQTRIVWRRHLPLENTFDHQAALRRLTSYFEAGPPHVTEILEAPSDRVAKWLKARFEAKPKETSAPEAPDDSASPVDTNTPAKPPVYSPDYEPLVVVLDDRLEAERFLFAADISPVATERLARIIAGRIIVVDSRVAGIDEHGLLSDKISAPPPTIDGDPSDWKLPLETFGSIRYRIARTSTLDQNSLDGWRQEGYRWIPFPDDDDPMQLIVEVYRTLDTVSGDAAVTKRKQGLQDHHDWARREVESIADALGLDPSRRQTLGVAAGSHDAGKDREIWQDAMHLTLDGRPYAKSDRGCTPSMLNGYRHEFGSLTDIRADPEFQSLGEAERELALHVIAAHHGRARPLINAFDPDVRPAVSEALAREVSLRFAKLQQHYNAWDLAWWEALVQSADWSASGRLNEETP